MTPFREYVSTTNRLASLVVEDDDCDIDSLEAVLVDIAGKFLYNIQQMNYLTAWNYYHKAFSIHKNALECATTDEEKTLAWHGQLVFELLFEYRVM